MSNSSLYISNSIVFLDAVPNGELWKEHQVTIALIKRNTELKEPDFL